MVQRIGQRRIQLPAQSVVQGERGFNLPTVLGKEINAGVADVFPLRGALRVAVVQAQQVAGIIIVVEDGIFGGAVESVLAADVVIKSLVELGAAHIRTKLNGVIALHPGQAVGRHEGVPHLRQFALPAVADGEAAGYADERNALCDLRASRL